jgi:hypothetical protein
MSASNNQRPTWAQILLGVFVVWQLLFMVGSNLLAFFPHGAAEEGELSDSRCGASGSGDGVPGQLAIEITAAVTDRWAHLTGQIQAWWLFAPSFPEQATFPVVELRWDDTDQWGRPSEASAPSQPVRLHSVLEPADPRSYFRPPGSMDRLFHYEIRLGLLMTVWDQRSAEKYRFSWHTAVHDRVRRQWRSIRAYLRWQVQQFQQLHPELPSPRQAVLLIAIYKTPTPEQRTLACAGPIERPLARWFPATDASEPYLPIEMCDPYSTCFVRLPLRTPK